MLPWIKRYLSFDDLLSVVGYVGLVALTSMGDSSIDATSASVLASGMLTMFWIASKNVRIRNADRYPNARVAFWAAVAVVSAVLTFL